MQITITRKGREAPLANFLLIIFTRWVVDLCLEDKEGFSILVAKLEARLLLYVALYSLYVSYKANNDNYLYKKNDQVSCFHLRNQLKKVPSILKLRSRLITMTARGSTFPKIILKFYFHRSNIANKIRIVSICKILSLIKYN